jgi:hypothetical protein
VDYKFQTRNNKIKPCVEARSNNSTVSLRVVGDEKGTQCLAIKLGHPVSGAIPRYGYLALQVGGVSNLR